MRNIDDGGDHLMQKKRVLFVNPRPAQCSIYQTGKSIYEILRSDDYILHYAEICDLSKKDFLEGKIVSETTPFSNSNTTAVLFSEYDVYLFNFHPITICGVEQIPTSVVKNFKGIKINISFEVDPNDPYPERVYSNFDSSVFDHHLILDPTLIPSQNNIHPFPRPLAGYRKVDLYTEIPQIPIIGTHGLATDNKNHVKIMQQASSEFEYSIFRMNMPIATYMGEHFARKIIEDCSQNKPENVMLVVTHTYFQDRNALIRWCSQNDLNAFFYYRDEPGIAAATDEALLSGSPICVTDNKHFRHLFDFIEPFPKWSLSDCILKSQKGIEMMSNLYNKENYISKFKSIINA